MKSMLIILLIATIIWALYETWKEKGIAYYLAKKDIRPTNEEIVECLIEVIKHYFNLKRWCNKDRSKNEQECKF